MCDASDNYELILDHKNVTNGFFSTSLGITGLENENDPTANTYSIIGEFTNDTTLRNLYKDENGKCQFKLIYRYSSGNNDTIDTLIWKQSSWITDSTITDSEMISLPSCYNGCDGNIAFQGLGLSDLPSTWYLDGNGGIVNAWNGVGQWRDYNGGITGFNFQFAYSQSLYIHYPYDGMTIPSFIIYKYCTLEYKNINHTALK